MSNKIPPPIVTLVFGLLIYFTRNYFPSYENISFVLNVLSIVLFIGGITITGTAIAAFKNHQTTVNPINIEKATSLVTSGIFMISRNPMYLGMFSVLLAVSLKFNLIGGIILSTFFMLFITKFQIIPEEIAMEKLFKDEFIFYKKKTRMWI